MFSIQRAIIVNIFFPYIEHFYYGKVITEFHLKIRLFFFALANNINKENA